MDAYDLSGNKFIDFPKAIDVYPSLFAKLDPNMITYSFADLLITVTFNTVDQYGDAIEDIGVICPSYYSFGRLIYLVGLKRD